MTDYAAELIAATIGFLQTRWTNQMDKLFNPCTIGTKRICLLLFCFTMVCMCTLITVKSFFTDRLTEIKISKINPPHTHCGPTIPDTSYKSLATIKRFKVYMDSLKRTESGQKIYDSINRYRSGLLDSLDKLEIIYSK